MFLFNEEQLSEGFFSKFVGEHIELGEGSNDVIKNNKKYESELHEFIKQFIEFKDQFKGSRYSANSLTTLFISSGHRDEDMYFEYLNSKRYLRSTERNENVTTLDFSLADNKLDLIKEKYEEKEYPFSVHARYGKILKRTTINVCPAVKNKIPNKEPSAKDLQIVWRLCVSSLNNIFIGTDGFTKVDEYSIFNSHVVRIPEESVNSLGLLKEQKIITDITDLMDGIIVVREDNSPTASGVFFRKNVCYIIRWDSFSNTFSLIIPEYY